MRKKAPPKQNDFFPLLSLRLNNTLAHWIISSCAAFCAWRDTQFQSFLYHVIQETLATLEFTQFLRLIRGWRCKKEGTICLEFFSFAMKTGTINWVRYVARKRHLTRSSPHWFEYRTADKIACLSVEISLKIKLKHSFNCIFYMLLPWLYWIPFI